MEFDVESNLSAVERAVSSSEREGEPARVVTLARSFPTSRANVWEAVTDQERIPRWFAPVGGELKLGGRFQIEGNASGEITACETLAHFALTWEFAGDVSWVEVHLAEDEDGDALLSLSHIARHSPFWDQYGAGAAGVGWEMAFLGLALYLAQPDWPKPDEMEFATSADGKAFLTGSSEGWAQAAIAAGEDPDAAHAAAKNTTAFFTGETAENS